MQFIHAQSAENILNRTEWLIKQNQGNLRVWAYMTIKMSIGNRTPVYNQMCSTKGLRASVMHDRWSRYPKIGCYVLESIRWQMRAFRMDIKNRQPQLIRMPIIRLNNIAYILLAVPILDIFIAIPHTFTIFAWLNFCSQT